MKQAEILLSKLLSEHGSLEMVLLIGSYGTERMRPDSDVDLAVSIGRPMSPEERIHLTQKLAEATHRPIDLIDLETAHGLILKQALRMGKPLTLSRPATFERLLKRMIYEQEDLNPQIQHAKKSRVESFTHGY
jgi:predicted nucleotidyltransferase